jgi:hypothetical protein
MRAILVCGSRDYSDPRKLFGELDFFKPDIIITGDAEGADHLAEAYGKVHDIPVFKFHANWKDYGRKAGYKRNLLMVQQFPRVCLCFYKGSITKGTKITRDLALKYGVAVIEYNE